MAKLNKEEVGFTQIKNEVLTDKKLSWKAKGLFAYLFSKPDGWDFSAERIALDSTGGREAVLSGIKELEKEGYLSRKKHGSGRVEYFLKYTNPKSAKPTVAKPHSAESRLISNKDFNTNTDKESNTLAPAIAVAGSVLDEVVKVKKEKTKETNKNVVEIMDLFKLFNPAASKWYAHTTQRSAVKRLLAQFPRPQLDKIVSFLPQINQLKYAPHAHTPYELEDKVAAIRDFVQSQRNSGKGKEILGL